MHWGNNSFCDTMSTEWNLTRNSFFYFIFLFFLFFIDMLPPADCRDHTNRRHHYRNQREDEEEGGGRLAVRLQLKTYYEFGVYSSLKSQ